MAIDERKFRELKKKADGARAARDKATGQLEAAMERLQNEYGCTTIEEAEKKLAQLDRDAAKAEAGFEKTVTAFEEGWDERLDEESA